MSEQHGPGITDAELAGALESALPELSIPQRTILSGFFSTAEAPPGAMVAREGDHERELLVLLRGEAKLIRGGLDVDVLRVGDRTGEITFVTGLPRPTTIVAVTRLHVARLSFERYRVLSATHPDVALALFEAFVLGLSRHAILGKSPGGMVRERSLPRKAELQVKIHGIARSVPTGTPVQSLLPPRMHGKLVVAALVDRRAVSLTTPLTSDCEVAALSTSHWEGQRIHRYSIALLALEAARRLDPEALLETGPSLGFAQQMFVRNSGERNLSTLAADLERSMQDLCDKNLLLREEWWTLDEARDHLAKEGSPAEPLLATWRDAAVPLASYGQAYVLSLGPLLPETGSLKGSSVLPGQDVLLLVYGDESSTRPLPSSLLPAVPIMSPEAVASGTLLAPSPRESEGAYVARHARRVSAHATALTLGEEQWLRALGVTSVGAFNRACVNGEVTELIRVSEGFHEKRIATIADEITSRARDARVVCIAGPSSSGKTTFIRRLQVQLRVNGIRPVGLSLDDYYVDRERTPRDASGEYDYEALAALRLDLLGDQLSRLLAGDTVQTARYDFGTGRSLTAGGNTISLEPDQVLMLEGIHGLNPALLSTLPDERVFRIFVCPLAQLPFDSLTRVHASDVRLLRRIVRDRHSRGTNAADNIQRWPSVRAGERQHIFPFQHHADAVFDSSLIYELSVLRVYGERYLLEVSSSHPSHTTAQRLIRMLDRFVTIYPDHVPPTSILREFIGGSGFEY